MRGSRPGPDVRARSPANGRLAHGGESYRVLVWRRFRRSISGMIGLVLVALFLVMASSPISLRRLTPRRPSSALLRRRRSASSTRTASSRLLPTLSDRRTAELDPITFQPLTGPDYEQPHQARLPRQGLPLQILLADPLRHPSLWHGRRAADTSAWHGQARSRHAFARHRWVAHLADHRPDRGDAHDLIGTSIGIASGYLGGRFDAWVQRFVDFVLAFPQLPLYLALTTLIPITAPSNVFIAFVIGVLAALGWAQLSREVRSKTLALARIEYVRAAMAVGASDGRIIFRHILPNVLSHVIVAVTIAIPAVVLLDPSSGSSALP